MKLSGLKPSAVIRPLCGKLVSLSASTTSVSNRAPLVLAVLSLLALLAGLAEQWFAFGVLALLILIGTASVGFGDSKPRVGLTLAGYLLLMVGLLGAIAYLHPLSDDSDLWLGLPPATAVLAYAFWPLQAIVGILYIREFSRTILPEDRLARFLATYSKNQK